jgi:hypothetical protein
MRKKSVIFLLSLVVCITNIIASPTVTQAAGGSIKVDLGYGIVLNKNSSIIREWRTLNDDIIPIKIIGTPGVSVGYDSGSKYSSSYYYYGTDYTIRPAADIVAFEIRFIVFDIWGDRQKNLSATEIVDIRSGTESSFSGKWKIYSENEASEVFASLAYIYQVRTKDGKVYRTNLENVVKEAQKFSDKFTIEDLALE